MKNTAPHLEPKQYFVTANGIRHRMLEWNSQGTVTLLLCHGFLDVSWSWVWVVEELLKHNYRIVAFDWRGHGESSPIGNGGYYHFPDYVLDLTELIPQISQGQSIHLIGHSMGGVASTLYASIHHEVLRSFVNVEGWGPPKRPTEPIPDRMARWISEVQKVRNHPARTMASLDVVVQRLQKQHHKLEHAQALFLAEKMTRQNQDGTFSWQFDPLHQTTSPFMFVTELFATFGQQIKIPTLFISASNGLKYDDLKERIQSVPDAKHIHMEDIGHMIHWQKPKELAAHIQNFVKNH